jgi:hypothetical protein
MPTGVPSSIVTRTRPAGHPCSSAAGPSSASSRSSLVLIRDRVAGPDAFEQSPVKRALIVAALDHGDVARRLEDHGLDVIEVPDPGAAQLAA